MLSAGVPLHAIPQKIFQLLSADATGVDFIGLMKRNCVMRKMKNVEM